MRGAHQTDAYLKRVEDDEHRPDPLRRHLGDVDGDDDGRDADTDTDDGAPDDELGICPCKTHQETPSYENTVGRDNDGSPGRRKGEQNKEGR